jgi:hydroxymethylbilane synthase
MPQTTIFLRIGTRGSPLALFQAILVRDMLAAAHGVAPERISIEKITTDGDRSQSSNRPLSEFGGKGLFSSQIEDRLLAGQIDIAVHSTKDMATRLPPGLIMNCFLEREDCADVLISRHPGGLEGLERGARIGTSSLRRAAQMRRARPDVQIVPLRGNVDTRIARIAQGTADATLLAAAGLNRLKRAPRNAQRLDPLVFCPAPGQGAIAIECRTGDIPTLAAIAPLNHPPTQIAIRAERAMLAGLDGSCRTPIGARTTSNGNQMTLYGEILSPDGTITHSASATGPASDPEGLGKQVAGEISALAGPHFFATLDLRAP